MEEEQMKGRSSGSRGSLLMNTAYFVHGILAPCLPVAISPVTKQTIRRWIGKVDELLDSASNACVLIPGSEEYYLSRSDKSL